MTQTIASIIQDSVSPDGKRLTTFQLAYPRIVHSEFLTHRVFSRNASSSRAIPVKTLLNEVRTSPAMPVHWGKNQPGMQAREEVEDIEKAKSLWMLAANNAADVAEMMMDMGLHKQVANRILEPFQIIRVVMTTSEVENFRELRHHEDADPNIYGLAAVLLKEYDASIPTLRYPYAHSAEGWHLPYILTEERVEHAENPRFLAMLSAARCARVSYLTHDGKKPDPVKDIELFKKLLGSRPLHASPAEHQAFADRKPIGQDVWFSAHLHGNFDGWVQHRKLIEMEVK